MSNWMNGGFLYIGCEICENGCLIRGHPEKGCPYNGSGNLSDEERM